MKLLAILAISLPAVAAQPSQVPECCRNTSPTFDSMHFIVNANPPPAGVVTGAATGKVLFEGKKPEPKSLEVMGEKATGCVPEGQQVDATDRSMLLAADGGVANVVVTIDVDGAELMIPDDPIVLDQRGCRFEPHVVAIPKGATVSFLNSDEVSHNVHLYPGKNEAFNQTIASGAHTDRKLDKTDRIRVKCDIHPWMESHIVVTDTPYMAITGADGGFSVPDLVPGKYEVEFWHEKLGKAKGELAIAEDGSSTALEVKMSAEKKSRGRRR